MTAFPALFAAFSRTKKEVGKRLASEPTLRPVTSARSADSLRGGNAAGCGIFCERFQSGWRLSSPKRRCPKDFGGALWPFRKEIEVIKSLKAVVQGKHVLRHYSR